MYEISSNDDIILFMSRPVPGGLLLCYASRRWRWHPCSVQWRPRTIYRHGVQIGCRHYSHPNSSSHHLEDNIISLIESFIIFVDRKKQVMKTSEKQAVKRRLCAESGTASIINMPPDDIEIVKIFGCNGKD